MKSIIIPIFKKGEKLIRKSTDHYNLQWSGGAKNPGFKIKLSKGRQNGQCRE